MDRVRVVGQVHQLPDLRRVEHRLLGYRHMPRRIVQQHPHRLLYQIHALIERQTPRLDRAALRNLCKKAAVPEEETCIGPAPLAATRNCMISKASLRSRIFSPACAAKSKTKSTRSAGAITTRCAVNRRRQKSLFRADLLEGQ